MAFAAASIPEWLAACGSSAGEATGTSASAVTAIDVAIDATKWVTVVRPSDMLRLRFNFVQMHRDVPTNTLVLDSPSTPGVILVEFPPQHVVEPTVPEPAIGSAPTTVPAPPIDARIAGTSLIGFLVPAGTAGIPYDLSALLTACTSFGLNVADNAAAASDDVFVPPMLSQTTTPVSDPDVAVQSLQLSARTRGFVQATSENLPDYDTPGASTATPSSPVGESLTAIELPYRVVLSPSAALRFAHSATPYQPGTSAFTELWTSRLARVSPTGGADETTRVPISVRAIWSPDITAQADPFPGNMALNASTRVQIVRQSSDFSSTQTQATRPIHAKRLALSARGGSLDVLADFGDNPLFGLNSWQHRTSVGRDAYVRVEEAGFLYPYGHSASVVTISERKFLANPGNAAGPRTGYLWQRSFIVIRQPTMQYVNLQFPFFEIRIVTPSTPPLDAPPTPLAPFWPTLGGVAFRFAAEYIDFEGNLTKATLAALWIPAQNVDTSPLQTQFANDTDPGLSKAPRNTSNFQRQRVAYTQTTPSTSGKTTYETQTITVQGVFSDFKPFFGPALTNTQINVPSVRQFSGADSLMLMEYEPTYLDNQFGTNNPGEVFLRLVAGNQPLSIDFGAQAQRAGAFVTPNMSVVALSRQVGPLAGTATAAGDIAAQVTSFASSGAADPSLLFGALAGTKLFGVFKLSDLFGGSLPLGSMPKFATEFLDVVGTLLRTVTQVENGLTDLQTAANTLTSAVPAQLSSALAQASAFGTAASALVSTLSVLPPPTPSTFASTAASQLSSVSLLVTTLQADVSAARSANSSLPAGQRLDDSAFASIDSVLRALSAMLATSGITEIEAAFTAIANIGELAANMTSRFEWQTNAGDIKAIDIGSTFSQVFFPGKNTVFKLVGEVRAHEVAGKPAGLDLTATLNGFDVNLLGMGAVATPNNPTPSPKSGFSNLPFITLSFDHLTFASMAGQKPDIDVGFSAITFQGPLSFLNALKSIIPLDGFGDPPGISVDASGIQGDFTLALPSLAIGVFALENISLGANFHIPFIGEPMTVGFNFAERENPFHLTVSLLGGGGYFLMNLSMQGVILIEAALEFGAQASIDLVVASGSVLIMGGIYFSYTPGGVTLTGYVRIAGSLSVLGLITASVEMRLDLGYQSSDGSVFGKATISIEVSILFFSESVNVSCEKHFGSCNGDPTFAEIMGPESANGSPASAWDEYCLAFAA